MDNFSNCFYACLNNSSSNSNSMIFQLFNLEKLTIINELLNAKKFSVVQGSIKRIISDITILRRVIKFSSSCMLNIDNCFVDPYVKDARCHIQALFMSNVKNYVLPENIIKVNDTLVDCITKKINSLSLYVKDRESINGSKVVPLLQTDEFIRKDYPEEFSYIMLISFFSILSCSRENFLHNPKIGGNDIVHKIFKRKNIFRKIVSVCKQVTKKIEEFYFEKAPIESISNKTPYLKSFITWITHSIQNSNVPFRIYIKRSCTLHSDRYYRFSLINTEESSKLFKFSTVYYLKPSTINLNEVMMVLLSSKNEKNSCDCDKWYSNIQQINFLWILLSYGMHHESVNPLFTTLLGTSRENSSIALVDHVYFTYDVIEYPIWQRKEQYKKY